MKEARQGARGAVVSIGARRYVLLSFARASTRETLGMSPAEQAVAAALLAGLSNAAIAQLRGSATRTVANQVASIYRKLGVQSRAELAAQWAELLSPLGAR